VNRRELLRLPGVVALTPALAKADKLGFALEEGPFYLFVVNPYTCDVNQLLGAFHGSKVRGAAVVAHDGDIHNALAIYKFED
jgi:hypothetical protein